MARKQPKITRSPLSDKAKRQLIAQHLSAKEEGRKQYAKSDRLLLELLAGGWKPGEKVAMGDVDSGLPINAELIDVFADKHKHFKTIHVSRYEVRVSCEQ